MNTLRGNVLLEKFHHPFFSYAVSANVSYQFQNNLSVSSGLSFDRKGSKSIADSMWDNNANYMGSGKTNHIVNYLVLPVTVEYRFGEKIQWHAGAGAFAGFLLGSKDKGIIKLANGSEIKTNQQMGKYKSFDFGLAFKTGVTIPSKKRHQFQIALRDHLGLMNISSTPVINDGSIKTNSLQLLFGVQYRL